LLFPTTGFGGISVARPAAAGGHSQVGPQSSMGRKRTDYSPAQSRQRALRLLRPVLRWSFKRKHQVCDAIRLGQLAEDEVIAAHGLTHQELGSWLAGYDRLGTEGLKITKKKR
jgi:hypothetical protein